MRGLIIGLSMAAFLAGCATQQGIKPILLPSGEGGSIVTCSSAEECWSTMASLCPQGYSIAGAAVDESHCRAITYGIGFIIAVAGSNGVCRQGHQMMFRCK